MIQSSSVLHVLLDTTPAMKYSYLMGYQVRTALPMYRYCGRWFTETELQVIRRITSMPQLHPTRAAVARAVCDALGWVRPDGRLKAMSARVALLRMQEDGLIRLPPPTHPYTPCRGTVLTRASADQPELCCPRKNLTDLTLHRVTTREESRLWNEFIARYHYLGYCPLPGAQARYLAMAGGRYLAALGFGAAAWKVACRDRFIGWTPDRRQAKLHLVVNNARFLILPWVRVPNLASCLLSLAVRRIRRDWPDLYGYRPVLLETFVERERFAGTCYKAANWLPVGCTQGRGKLDRYHRRALPVKDVYLFPLTSRFRPILTGEVGT